MDTATLFQNGLPNELASIPAGQIFILTSPLGITLKNHSMIWRILQVAKHCHQEPILHTLQVENPELWSCVACRVQQGDEIVIANEQSLLEMLCELWGLDLKDVCNNNGIPMRSILGAGKEHPIRVPLTLVNGKPLLAKEGNTPTMEMYQVHTREGALGDIRSILQDNFKQNLGISASDLIKIFEEEQNRERPTWHLDIKLGEGNTGYNKNWELVEKVKCEINLVDPSGTPHQLDIKAQNLALYLTFILFKDGIKLSEIQNDEFFTIFKTMCERLPYINEIPEDGKTLKKYSGDKRNQILRQITNIIKDDQYLIKQFAIEGYTGEPYKVAASTDEQREAIKKAFGIE